jgi:retron-type reverse transcriptase
MTLAQAIREVEQGRCQRIASPSKWKVWREGDKVKHEVLGQ